MAIAQATRKAFVERKLDSCHWMKELSEAKVDRMLAKLDPPPVFHTKPYLHQKVLFLIGLHYPHYLPLLDMGLGKSKIMLDLISYRKRIKKFKRAIVMVPNVANIESWLDEVRIHAPRLKATGLFGGSADRRRTIEFIDDSDIFIINYAGLVHMLSERQLKPGKRKGGTLRPSKKMCSEFIKEFDTIILDESTAVRHKGTLAFRICSFLARRCEYRYALTGTPFGRDPHDLWGQFYVIDRGATLGATLGIFRECFFDSSVNYFGGYEHKFDRKLEGLLHRTIQHRSISYQSDELSYLNLPPAVFTKRRVKMTKEVEHLYKTGVQEIQYAAKLGQRMQIERHFMQLRQLASGFLYQGKKNEDDPGPKQVVDFDPNPKIEALLEIVDSMPPKSKMVLFNEFVHSGDLISQALKAAKVGHARLYSGTKDATKEVKTFKLDPKCRVFLINSQSGAFGLNLQNANYCVFYESPVSPIVRKQAERRCHRIGQKNRVFYYDLICKGSVEERILGFLREGKNLFEALIRGKVWL
jgi:SNF2 family DNA or RNA helicase